MTAVELKLCWHFYRVRLKGASQTEEDAAAVACVVQIEYASVKGIRVVCT